VRGTCRNLAPAPVGADDGRASALSRVVRRLRDERGIVLMELIVTMGILGLVVGGITSMLVSATKHEARLNLQFQAQESARLALTTLRSDLHCASAVSPTSGNVSAITLTLNGCRTGTGSFTWCTVPNGTRYDLWRIPAAYASCTASTTSTSGSRLWAQGVSAATIFTPNATTHASAVLPAVGVDFSITAGTSRSYRLTDVIYLRNGART
jgi:type II secretory pathway pseudopilin PulG